MSSQVPEPIWIRKADLILLHDESLALHGGASGLRDEGLLESALARAKNKFWYEQVDDMATLAAAYAFGLAKNHVFIDGNKRSAFLSIGLFLGLNGYGLKASPVAATLTIEKLAASTLDETEMATWIKTHLVKV